MKMQGLISRLTQHGGSDKSHRLTGSSTYEPDQDEVLTKALLRKELHRFMEGPLQGALRQLGDRMTREARLGGAYKTPRDSWGGRGEQAAPKNSMPLQEFHSVNQEWRPRTSVVFADEIEEEIGSDDDLYLTRFMKCHTKQKNSSRSSESNSGPKSEEFKPEVTSHASIVHKPTDFQRESRGSFLDTFSQSIDVSQGLGVMGRLSMPLTDRTSETAGYVPLVSKGQSANRTTIDRMPQDAEGSSRENTDLHVEHTADSDLMAGRMSSRDDGFAKTYSGDEVCIFDEDQSPPETSTEFNPFASVKETVRTVVDHIWFEHLSGFFVLLNAIWLGFMTDYMATHRTSSSDYKNAKSFIDTIDLGFLVVFTLELVLRICAYGGSFFTMSGWRWNVFDSIVVLMMFLDQATQIEALEMNIAPSFLRSIRILRLIRITRLARVVRSIEELQSIVSSIASSLVALLWTLLLLIMMIYALSVFFTQVAVEATNAKHREALNYWYGTTFRTMLTMFEVITGGVSWDECIWPLIVDVHPMMGLGFVIYIAFCVFAMMNMATGVFVERATHKAQEDQDAFTAKHISDLFFTDPEIRNSPTKEVTWEFFNKKMDTPDMQEYFKMINVDPSEARGLFQLLDADDSGSVDADELVNGCLRLRGHAKALELSLLMHQSMRMFKRIRHFQGKVERRLDFLCKHAEADREGFFNSSIDRESAPINLRGSASSQVFASLDHQRSEDETDPTSARGGGHGGRLDSIARLSTASDFALAHAAGDSNS